MPSRIAKSNNKGLGKNSKKEHEALDVENNEAQEPFQDHVLALPQDVLSDSQSPYSEDGYLLNKSHKVVRIGSKVNTEFNSDYIENDSVNSEEQNLGKKDNKNSASSLNSLKKKFGFSWKSVSRKFGVLALVVGILGVVVLSGVAALAIDRWNNTPSIDNLLNRPSESSVVYAADGKTKIYEFFSEGTKREIISVCTAEILKDPNANCIPESMQMAIVGLEDEEFYKNFQNNNGIPWKNIAGAALTCVSSGGDECRGGSGLSQQLVKNVTKKADNSLDRKIDELFIAIKLNNEIKDPQQILERYLNQNPFGRNTYGIQAASITYFGKKARDLTVVESCYLASLPQRPTYYEGGIKDFNSDAWKDFVARKNICLEKLQTKALKGDAEGTYIKTEAELKILQEQETVLAKDEGDANNHRKDGKVAFIPNKIKDDFPHFREYVTEELRKFIPRESDLYTKGYQIITTLDVEKQKSIDKIVKDSEKINITPNGANNASSLVLDGPTGEIVSMVGSLGYDRTDNEIDGKVNIMTSPQQPGSSIKPYVYAAALNKGFNPATVVVDATTDFGGGYKPKNFSGTVYGPVSLRKALQGSLNISTLKTACIAAGEGSGPDCGKGINEVFDFAEKTGLRFPCYAPTDGKETCNDPNKASEAYRKRCFLASALGGCEITGISHATGMNTLLHEGNLRTATPFKSIKDSAGKELYTSQAKQNAYPSEDKVIDPLIAKQVVNMLTDYDARRFTFAQFARNLEIAECPNGAAAKTGTTNDVKDTWAVGGCSNYTTVVWVGNTGNKGMNRDGSSSNAAAPVWNRIMKYLEKGQKPKPFNYDGLVRTSVDPTTGFVGGSGSELLTPNQKKILDEAGGKLSKPDYDAKTKNIYDYRSSIISQEIEINRLDGKRATSQTLPENIEKKVCLQLISEFPGVKAWADPVDALAKKSPDKYCIPPSENSDQDQSGEQGKAPVITTNLSSDTTNLSSITLSALPQGAAGKSITKLEILIDGAVAKSDVGINSTILDVNSLDIGPHSIILRATDNFGAVSELSFSGVTFGGGGGTSPLNNTEIAGISFSCDSAVRSTSTNCSFTLPASKTLPGLFRIRIGGAGSQICSVAGLSVSCGSVPTPATAGSKIIEATTNGIFVATGETVVIT